MEKEQVANSVIRDVNVTTIYKHFHQTVKTIARVLDRSIHQVICVYCLEAHSYNELHDCAEKQVEQLYAKVRQLQGELDRIKGFNASFAIFADNSPCECHSVTNNGISHLVVDAECKHHD